MGAEVVSLSLPGVLHGLAPPSKAGHPLTFHGAHIGHHSPVDGEEGDHDVVLTVVVTGLVMMEEEDLPDHEEKQLVEDLDPLETAMEVPCQDVRWVTPDDDQMPLAHFETELQEEVEPRLCCDPPVPSNPE